VTTVFVFIWIAVLISLAMWACWTFDQLIVREHALYHGHWRRDGKPIGFLYIPREARVLGGWAIRPGSVFALHKLTLVWLFSTPQWMRDDGEALRLLRRWRILNIVYAMAFLGTLVVLYLS
jgi:hypothetical protein